MATIRVISGSAKGRRLHSVPGIKTRPITDRVKESLFDIIGADIIGSTFWDIFAGTGSVGIEALSRGAVYVQFVDIDFLAIRTIKRNLEITRLNNKSRVIRTDAFKLIALKPERSFDYVYIAPPQYKELWKKSVFALDKNHEWLNENGWLIVQIHPIEYQCLNEGNSIKNFLEFDQRKYGSTLLVFYNRKQQ